MCLSFYCNRTTQATLFVNFMKYISQEMARNFTCFIAWLGHIGELEEHTWKIWETKLKKKTVLLKCVIDIHCFRDQAHHIYSSIYQYYKFFRTSNNNNRYMQMRGDAHSCDICVRIFRHGYSHTLFAKIGIWFVGTELRLFVINDKTKCYVYG